MTDPLDSALRLAQRGFEVLPCHAPSSGGCSCRQPECGSPGKHPRTRNGLYDATVDPSAIRRWWRQWPDANLGIRTGAASGLVVIDVDPDHGGLDSMRSLAAEHAIPKGLRVRTGSGGWHLYFAHPGGHVRNSAGTALGPGVDVRGDGGYVIAPPSRHASGGVYRWTGKWELPDLPDHLLERIRPPERHVAGDQSSPRSRWTEPVRIDRALSAWAARALDDEASQVRTAASGGRNHRLNRAAFSLGQIVGAGLLDADTVADQLHHAALGAGLGAREATTTIRSGLQAGMTRPRIPAERSVDPANPPSVEASVNIDLDVDMGSG
ncbi:MAG: bifunctional DNA primase/polymerase [Acidimicrobiales bacterium]